MVGHPAPASVNIARNLSAGRGQRINQIKERFVALAQARHLGRPVVHLGVDIERPAGAPWRVQNFIPDPLKVGGLGSRAGGRNEKVAPVLEKKGDERGIVRAEAGKAHIGRQIGHRTAQIQLAAIEEGGEVRAVALEEGRKWFSLHGIECRGSRPRGIKLLLPGRGARAGEIRGGGKMQDHLVRAFHMQPVIIAPCAAAHGARPELDGEGNPLVTKRARSIPEHFAVSCRIHVDRCLAAEKKRPGIPCRRLATEQAVKRGREGNAPRFGRLKPRHKNLVGGAGKIFAGLAHTGSREGNLSRRGGKLQPPLVGIPGWSRRPACYCIKATGTVAPRRRRIEFPLDIAVLSVGEPNSKVSHGKIGLPVGSLRLAAAFLRRRKVPAKDRFPRTGKSGAPAGNGIITRRARPERIVIEREKLLIDPAIDHRAQAPVAQRKSLVERCGRAAIPEGERIHG